MKNVGRGSTVGMTGWRHSNSWIFMTMFISAIISLYASLQLSINAYKKALSPDLSLSCDINSAISCSKVGDAWQSTLLGFPNAFIGLMSEPVVITIAVAGLSGVVFKRWFMFAAQITYFAGLLFAWWLFYQSAFVIGALCPYCLLVTFGTTAVFFTLLHYNIRENNLYLPDTLQSKVEMLVRVGADVGLIILTFAIYCGIIVLKYGDVIFS